MQKQRVIYRSIYHKHPALKTAFLLYDKGCVSKLCYLGILLALFAVFVHTQPFTKTNAEIMQVDTTNEELEEENDILSEPEPTPKPQIKTYYIPLYLRPVITTSFSGYHQGIDLAAQYGTEIHSITDGLVTHAGWGYYGITIMVKENDTDWTVYGHLSNVNVRAGQYVNQGNVLGKVGCTGRCTGPHLHLEIYQDGYAVNPRSILGI